MTDDDLARAGEVLSEFGAHVGNLPEERADAAFMLGVLSMAHSYLIEYRVHIHRGLEPYDALLATAKGQLDLTQQQKDLWRALTPPTAPE